MDTMAHRSQHSRDLQNCIPLLPATARELLLLSILLSFIIRNTRSAQADTLRVLLSSLTVPGRSHT